MTENGIKFALTMHKINMRSNRAKHSYSRDSNQQRLKNYYAYLDVVDLHNTVLC